MFYLGEPKMYMTQKTKTNLITAVVCIHDSNLLALSGSVGKYMMRGQHEKNGMILLTYPRSTRPGRRVVTCTLDYIIVPNAGEVVEDKLSKRSSVRTEQINKSCFMCGSCCATLVER